MFAFQKPKALGAALGLALWLAAVVGGGAWLYARNFDAAPAGAPHPSWPSASRLRPASAGCTLVVALHPECPCSAATVEELAGILARTSGRLEARLLFAQYDDLSERAEDSSLWKKAAALPGVTLVADHGSEEIHRFDARSSGETRLYDAKGLLLFKGGITLGRGHRGDNPGQAAVCALARNDSGEHAISTPVFGCAL